MSTVLSVLGIGVVSCTTAGLYLVAGEMAAGIGLLSFGGLMALVLISLAGKAGQ